MVFASLVESKHTPIVQCLVSPNQRSNLRALMPFPLLFNFRKKISKHSLSNFLRVNPYNCKTNQISI
jgi:hypothetical protein